MDVEEEIIGLEKRLAKFDQQIEQLELEINSGNRKLREDLRPQMKVIRQRRRYAEERLEKIRLAKAESWLDEDFRVGILTIFDDIGRRINSLFSYIA